VGGWFRPCLQTKAARCLPEYHPRQWVDRSGPAYRRRPRAASPEYHPRQWVDRSSPAYRRRPRAASPEYHPRQWVDRSSPAYRGAYRDSRFSSAPSVAPQGRAMTKQGGGAGSLCRLDLNDPPTPVGGIQTSGRVAVPCRLGLNHPPTAVGGIPGVFTQFRQR